MIHDDIKHLHSFIRRLIEIENLLINNKFHEASLKMGVLNGVELNKFFFDLSMKARNKAYEIQDQNHEC